jgi:AbrB family looped-hinge helix DNA binding protein
MAKVTSKRQVTIPKSIADRCDIAPGDEIDFLLDGGMIRIQLGTEAESPTVARKLELFDHATERELGRHRDLAQVDDGERGWRREDLYERAGSS